MNVAGFVPNDPRLVRTAEHRYYLGEIELLGVTSVLAEAGLSDFSGPWFSDVARERGQLVHEAIALDVEGDLDDDTLDPALAPYVAGWRLFLAETGAIVEHSEAQLCDPALGLAGTLDLIVRYEDGRIRREVLDIKPALYPSVGPQTAAYSRMARALYSAPVYFSRAVLLLPGDGAYTRWPLTETTDDALFLSALRVVQFRRCHGIGRRAA